MANWIVDHFGEFIDMKPYVEEGKKVVLDMTAPLAEGQVAINPTGYQTVLYVTLALYIVSMLICFFMVRPAKKEAENN